MALGKKKEKDPELAKVNKRLDVLEKKVNYLEVQTSLVKRSN